MPRRAVRVLAAKRAPALLLRADGAMPSSVPPRVVIATASGPAGEALPPTPSASLNIFSDSAIASEILGLKFLNPPKCQPHFWHFK